jgi:hypothetical protein
VIDDENDGYISDTIKFTPQPKKKPTARRGGKKSSPETSPENYEPQWLGKKTKTSPTYRKSLFYVKL